MTLNITLKV